MAGQLIMYTTQWCGFCRNLKRQLAKDGIEMTEIDIEQDPAAAEYVMSVNGGNQTVPTVVFPDGASPNIPQNGTFSKSFPTAGSFDYACGIHPSMKGTVIVK